MKKKHSSKSKYEWKEDKTINKDICFECGGNNQIHYHHVVPEIKGGTQTIPLCIICHGKVHGKNFLKQSELIKIGIERAKSEGKYKGRKTGSTITPEDFLKKPRIVELIEKIKNNYSIHYLVKEYNCSPNTILKIKQNYFKVHGKQIEIDKNVTKKRLTKKKSQ